MKIKKEQIAFLIRAYNEASRIGGVIDSILKAGYKKILVVNDGSKDDTAKIVRNRENVFYVEHPQNRGAGAALETGLEFFRRNASEIGVDYVVTFDADWQHAIEDMPRFVEAFEKDDRLDIVLGSRFITKTNSNVPFFRHIILMGGKLFTWAISGIKLTDAHNGYRMMKVEALKKITLTMDGMEYASEFVEQMNIQGLRFKEVPVNIHYDDYTMGKGQRFGGAWRIASKILWWKFFR